MHIIKNISIWYLFLKILFGWVVTLYQLKWNCYTITLQVRPQPSLFLKSTSPLNIKSNTTMSNWYVKYDMLNMIVPRNTSLKFPEEIGSLHQLFLPLKFEFVPTQIVKFIVYRWLKTWGVVNVRRRKYYRVQYFKKIEQFFQE